MLITPAGVIDTSDAVCVVFTSNVVDTVAPPLAASVAGVNEHCAVAGNPVQEKVTLLAKPLRGVTCRSSEPGWPGVTVRAFVLVERAKSADAAGVTAPIVPIVAFDM